MFDENTLRFIREKLAEGKTKEEIMEMLRTNGWSENGITALFEAFEGNQGATQGSNIAQNIPRENVMPNNADNMGPQPNTTANKIPGVFGLINEAFSLCKKRFLTLFGILVLPIVIFFVLIFAVVTLFGGFSAINNASSDSISWGFVLTIVLLLIGFIIVQIWSALSLIVAVADRTKSLGVIASYKTAWRRLHSYVWVQFLVGVTTMGGFLLLFVPGVIFAVWFIFSVFLLIDDDKRGFKALLSSREYVRGRWWQVFGRLLGGGLVILIISLAVQLLLQFIAPESVVAILNYIIQLFVQIFLISYIFVLYKNVKDRVGAVEVDSKKRVWFIVVAIVGGLIIPVIFLSVIVASLGSAKDKAGDELIQSSLNFAQSDAELYHFNNGDSYEGVYNSEEVADAIRDADETNNEGNVYCTSSKDRYAISADLIDGGSYCIDSQLLSKSIYPNEARPGLSCN